MDYNDDNLPPAVAEPCKECPWRRKSTRGHLGPHSAEEWLDIVHGESAIACHMTITQTDDKGVGSWGQRGIRQCAGSAIFRTNVCKNPRNPDVAVAEEGDDVTIFAWNNEFIDHHKEMYDRLQTMRKNSRRTD